nr:putative late blight resistance protein homolog R1A-10 [Nicotiana tomentosiformis]
MTAVYHDKGYDPLLEQLYRKLKGKRYLIVMDDLCSIEAWELVKRLFPDDNNGSRIMITTRLLEVADCAGNGCPPHHMPFLNSWTSLSDKVFGKEDCPPQLEEIGKQMAEHCQGLPLSLVVIGSTNEHCLTILSLSYNWLPPSLKACFLYMGVFPEDAKIDAKRLIRVWVAEGFLKRISHKKMEKVAEECLEDLVSRSLIMVRRREWVSGKISCCRVHDLVRLLCLREGKADKFFHVINKCYEVSSRGMEIEHRLFLHENAVRNRNLGLKKGNLDSVRTILCS